MDVFNELKKIVTYIRIYSFKPYVKIFRSVFHAYITRLVLSSGTQRHPLLCRFSIYDIH